MGAGGREETVGGGVTNGVVECAALGPRVAAGSAVPAAKVGGRAADECAGSAAVVAVAAAVAAETAVVAETVVAAETAVIAPLADYCVFRNGRSDRCSCCGS